MELEDITFENCCCDGVDMEMKNAVAIQRNSAAIMAVIKALQAMQSDVEDLKRRVAELEDSDSIP